MEREKRDKSDRRGHAWAAFVTCRVV